MKRIYFLFLIAFVLSSCQKEIIPFGFPKVVVSLPPYSYLAQQIAQDKVNIEVLVSEGFNPHLYDPTPKEVDRLAKADLWFRSEEPFERKILASAKSNFPTLKIVDLLEGISLLSYDSNNVFDVCGSVHEEEGKDKHVWMSLTLAKQQAHTICEELINLMPEHKDFFEKNLKMLVSQMDELNKRITSLLLPFQGMTVLVSHPSLGYFCEEYQLEQLAVECDGKELRPQEAAKLLSYAKNAGVQAILIQAQYNNRGALYLAEQLNIPVHYIDPYSADYLMNLNLIAETIANP